MLADLVRQEKRKGETARSKQAFLDYLALGPERSTTRLIKLYRDPDRYGSKKPPTQNVKKLEAWLEAFNWPGRVSKVQDDQIESILAEEGRQMADVLRTKYAGRMDRIEALSEIASVLIDMGKQTEFVLQKVTNTSGKSKTVMEKVDLDLVQGIRGVLADLALETGGRAPLIKLQPGGGKVASGVPGYVFLMPANGRDDPVGEGKPE